ncbi:MAG: trimeric intracellular cation channel family protein [Clostridia bacterium]|nr:trimeric intracellular cation channel family protein [Clostridia bacterium]
MDFLSILGRTVEILGTIAFALSGSLVGIDRGLDFFGVMVLGVITAVGGGITRDIILGNTPPAAFLDPTFVLIAVGMSVVCILAFNQFAHFLTPEIMSKLMISMKVLDALGLALFTVSGMNIAINMGFSENPFLMVSVGVITGVGGGLLRDIFVHKTPMIFKKNIYATASAIGGIVYYFCLNSMPQYAGMLVGASVITAIRFIAMYKDINLPKFSKDDYYFD